MMIVAIEGIVRNDVDICRHVKAILAMKDLVCGSVNYARWVRRCEMLLVAGQGRRLVLPDLGVARNGGSMVPTRLTREPKGAKGFERVYSVVR